MATAQTNAHASVPAGDLYARWRAAPQYRLINLAGDPVAWHVISLEMLALLAFDQCLVFGAVYTHEAASLDRVARRDTVVMQTRKALWSIYDCVAKRMTPQQRQALMHEVALAVECGTGSPGSLLPFTECDPDPSVRAAASARADALRSDLSTV